MKTLRKQSIPPDKKVFSGLLITCLITPSNHQPMPGGYIQPRCALSMSILAIISASASS